MFLGDYAGPCFRFIEGNGVVKDCNGAWVLSEMVALLKLMCD